jgi:hypothetical protein
MKSQKIQNQKPNDVELVGPVLSQLKESAETL